MKKTARLIITFDCNRKCSYCVNNAEWIKKVVINIDRLDVFRDYKEIIITGGEPLYDIDKVIRILNELNNRYPDKKIYLYTSIFKDGLYDIINQDLLDGITFTLHSEIKNMDIYDLRKMEELICQGIGMNLSTRLKIAYDIEIPISIIPNIWDEISTKHWKKPEECKLLEHETLFIYEGE